jgi:competence protein ComEC
MGDLSVTCDPLGDRLSRRLPGRKLTPVAVALTVTAVLIWLAALQLPDGRLHVAFLDVGQGDAILIRTPDGKDILVDGGPRYTSLASALGQRLPFWDRALDLVILTHPDADHMTAAIQLFERYRVQRALTSPATTMAPEASYWREAATAAGIDVTDAQRGMQVALGRAVHLDVLHPDALLLASEPTDNNASIVLRLTYGAVSILLTGDLEAAEEENLLASGQPLSADVLKVSHHGSDTATTPAFLRAVNPAMAIIQVGADNDFGHPHAALLERLAAAGVQVWRTDLHGAIEVTSDGQTLSLRTAKRLLHD